ncbi:glycosyltransferase family 2 protein [Lacticigenium naphthae]|uniref:glycosyltransferase family 2 protein n=1 Tax=Lacticigenium naphthae TaxID=515351 RepID=UPI0003FDC0F4|nr:glycosyltransferase family 2 protein [Lacticigenium naphthae]
MKGITIIIPAYNEAESLDKLVDRLDEVTHNISGYMFTYLFINDGSTDNTLELLQEKAENHPRVSYLDLSRNFGKETAMLAGLDYASDEAVIILDADLQHPPEIIEEMIKYWEQGYEDVYAVREKKEDEDGVKNFFSKTYYKFVQKITSEQVYPSAGDFRLLDRKCVMALRELRENERYMKGMYGWIGFHKKEISYKEEPRFAGETKFDFSELFKLAINGITSYSTVPLRMWSYIGFFTSLISFLFLAYEIGKTILFGSNSAGYPTLLAAILFLGGIQLISLGVMGEYLGRVFIETKGRPAYFIREKHIKTKKEVHHE